MDHGPTRTYDPPTDNDPTNKINFSYDLTLVA